MRKRKRRPDGAPLSFAGDSVGSCQMVAARPLTLTLSPGGEGMVTAGKVPQTTLASCMAAIWSLL